MGRTLLVKLKYLKWLLNIRQNPTIKDIEDFVDSFYMTENMPQEFYELLLQKIRSKQTIKTILNTNIYGIISHLKNNNEKTDEIMMYVTPQDYFRIPKKRINKLIKLLEEMPKSKNYLDDVIEENIQWKLRRRATNQYSEYQELAYKLCIYFGFENASEIIGQKYGSLNYEQLHYFIKNLDKPDISDEERMVIYNYLFGSKNEYTNPLRMMISGRFPELFINFDYFVNNIQFFIEKLGIKFKSDKLKVLLQERFLTFDPTVPEITGDIKEDMLSSYYHKYTASSTREEEVLEINKNIYMNKLRNKYKSSIPQIKLSSSTDIKPELLPLSSPRNLTHGYRSGNCFRLNGDASILFSQFLESEHMRILSFSTPEYKDYAMVLLMRNGNVLIAQGIETSKWVPPELKGKRLYDLTKDALCQIMDYMNSSGDEIVATIIGATNANVSNYNNKMLPFLVSPILKNSSNYYNGISSYQCLMDLLPGKTTSDIKLYTPESRYCDEREKIMTSNNCFNPELEKRIIALRFQRSQTSEGFSFYQEMSKHRELQTICNKDWYITEFTDGTVDSYISDTEDPRAKEEYKKELAKVYQKR